VRSASSSTAATCRRVTTSPRGSPTGARPWTGSRPPCRSSIENTAGGDNAISRHFDRIGQLWEAFDGCETPFGFCLDTCHTHAAGEDLAGAVDRIVAITGGIDLLHLNDSKDAPGSGRDRHQNLGQGEIGLDLLVEVVQQAGADVVLETPEKDGGEHAAEIAFLRSRLAIPTS
jgi:deoxyribonuclease IV